MRIDPAEELRFLEWGQRLHYQRRNLAFSKQVTGQISLKQSKLKSLAPIDSLGQSLSLASIQGGSQAVGRKTGFSVGAWGDWFTLDKNDSGINILKGITAQISGYLRKEIVEFKTFI